MYITLLSPVIAGEPTPPIALVAAAADYASTAVNRRLPFAQWSFMNAELTVHLARPPQEGWVGVETFGVLGRIGTGFTDAALYDEHGRLGRAA